MLQRSVGEECCEFREVLEKSSVEECCREVLARSAGERSWKEVLEKMRRVL